MIPVSQQTLEIIKQFEGFRATAYRDQGGVWTIGYGTTRINGHYVRPGATITEAEASQILAQQVAAFQVDVLQLVTVPLTDNQLSALVSFAYNLGIGALKSSTLLRLLNEGDYAGAAAQFRRWDYCNGKPDDGLLARREQESSLFSRSEDQTEAIA